MVHPVGVMGFVVGDVVSEIVTKHLLDVRTETISNQAFEAAFGSSSLSGAFENHWGMKAGEFRGVEFRGGEACAGQMVCCHIACNDTCSVLNPIQCMKFTKPS